MPTYVFECPKGHHTEVVCRYDDRPPTTECEFEGCSLEAHHVIVPTTVHPDFEPYWDNNLADDEHPDGQMVYTRQQRASEMRRIGLEEIGETDYTRARARERARGPRIWSFPKECRA